MMPLSAESPATPSSPPPAVAIAISRYNASITERLLQGALDAYASRGGDIASVAVLDAPGAYELPAICLAAARTSRFAGVVALGCLIRGETRHDRYIAEAVAHGLVSITIATGIPVTFGVLTVDTPKQARERAGGERGNKGADAMSALLDTIAVSHSLAHAKATGSWPITGRPISAPDKARTAAGGH